MRDSVCHSPQSIASKTLEDRRPSLQRSQRVPDRYRLAPSPRCGQRVSCPAMHNKPTEDLGFRQAVVDPSPFATQCSQETRYHFLVLCDLVNMCQISVISNHSHGYRSGSPLGPCTMVYRPMCRYEGLSQPTTMSNQHHTVCCPTIRLEVPKSASLRIPLRDVSRERTKGEDRHTCTC